MLELKDICFERQGKKILDHINLVLEESKFYVITGPNGSGKSTLAKIIMGIEKPDAGKIIFNGEDITEKTIDERAKLGIGFAFQQPVQFKGITVYDLLKLEHKIYQNNYSYYKKTKDILSKLKFNIEIHPIIKDNYLEKVIIDE